MSTDSGQPPQPPEEEPGYWERKAAEQASQQPPPPAAPPAYPTAPPTGAPNPYGGYTAPSPGWAGQPGFPAYAVPDHPKSTAALVVGIISIAGAFFCVLPILAAPVAWVLGVQARKEIRNAPQQWGGEGKATAGFVLGIIGTVLLVLGLIAIALIVVVAINDPTAFDSDTGV